MEETTYDKLAAPFAQTFKKPGSNADYLTGEQVTTRLNEVLGWDRWNFRVLSHGVDESQVWALGQLEVVVEGGGLVTRQQFGSQVHQRNELGDDLKAAATDAMKKCASLIGVGLYLSEKDVPGEQQPAGNRPAPAQSRPAAAAPAKRKGFWEVLLEMGYSRDTVEAESQRKFNNRIPSQLTEKERKELVVALEEAKKKESA